MTSQLAKFRARLVVDGDCLVYDAEPYNRNASGHCRIRVLGRRLLVHRLAWELAHGPIPDGLCVLHRCDNPPCVALSHLWLGTVHENNTDCAAKGRMGTLRGEQSLRHKLTEADVRDVRSAWAAGVSARALARCYGVTPPAIDSIVHRRTWAHVA